jgi:hypothetical protein
MTALPVLMTRPSRRRAAVIRRALRREAGRLREPRRMAAMAVLIVAFALTLAGLIARGEAAGADARAYWAAVRIWIEGGNPYYPAGPFLPYVYAPWMVPLFAPWALLPWEVAWFTWRGATILLLLWSIQWAYARRPLATAVLVGLLAFPFAANLDTGNINVLLALAVFAAQFTGPRTAGLLWALATWMKWMPAPFLVLLAPRARYWGIVWLAVSALLSIALLPLTIVQLQVLFGFEGRPPRVDYLVFIWAAVPWWWRRRDPFAFLRPSAWRTWLGDAGAVLSQWRQRIARDPGGATRLARREITARARAFLGLGAPTS